MLIIWGSKLYGKTDEVKGLFHVATTFGHLWFLPLLPMGSSVVLAKDGDAWQGVKIRLSVKSWLLAWARLGLFALAMFLIVPAVIVLADKQSTASWVGPTTILLGVMALAGWAWVMFGKWSRVASYARAHKLGERVGLNERGRLMIDVAYGMVSEAEAKAAFAQLDAADEVAAAAKAEALAELQLADATHPTPQP